MAARILREFLRGEDGQDVVEFTLLLAFIMVLSSALFIDSGQYTSRIWNKANRSLDKAAIAAGVERKIDTD